MSKDHPITPPYESKLAQRLQAVRASLSEQNRILRRARRLYVAIVFRQLTTTEKVSYCARRAQSVGLYCAATPEREVRFSLLRKKWKLETGGKDWHGWVRKNGWSFYQWRKEIAA